MIASSLPPQLPLSVRLRDDARFDNFIDDGNEPVLMALRSLVSDIPLDNFMYLWGSPGAGCSHLLQAACQHFSENHSDHVCSRVADASSESYGHTFYLSVAEVIDHGPEVLESLESVDLLCIDDIQLMVGREDWEQAFFHLFNRLRDQGKRLLVAAKQSPAELDIQLPDLLSRLRSGLCFQLHSLSDESKCAALMQRAKLRGLELNEEAAHYVLSRHQRDTGALFDALDLLDEASLTAKRKLTIPFIKSVFNW